MKKGLKVKELFVEIWDDPARRERFIFGVIVFFGIAILLLGMLQIYSNIRAPFIRQALESQLNRVNQITALSQPNQAPSIEELKNADTDQDGLTDYEELYIYNTSPYLEDSDSDGQTDKQEIDSQTDPNCPKGQICQSQPNINTNSSTNSGFGNVSQFSLPTGQIDQSQLLNQIMNGQVSPDQLRQMLLESGLSADVVSQFDDQTLIEVYIETLEQINSGQ